MAVIKLKVLNKEGHTLATSQTGERVNLVYAGCYQPGDWIVLESDSRELFCEIQLEDSMPPAVVYLPEGNLQFHIPPRGQPEQLLPQELHWPGASAPGKGDGTEPSVPAQESGAEPLRRP